MEFFGLIAFMLAILNIDLPEKVKKLSQRVKRLEKIERKQGEKSMSKMIQSLIGTKCTITFDEGIQMEPYLYDILEVDEEWVKISRVEKNGQTVIRVVRIDNIKGLQPEV